MIPTDEQELETKTPSNPSAMSVANMAYCYDCRKEISLLSLSSTISDTTGKPMCWNCKMADEYMSTERECETCGGSVFGGQSCSYCYTYGLDRDIEEPTEPEPTKCPTCGAEYLSLHCSDGNWPDLCAKCDDERDRSIEEDRLKETTFINS